MEVAHRRRTFPVGGMYTEHYSGWFRRLQRLYRCQPRV